MVVECKLVERMVDGRRLKGLTWRGRVKFGGIFERLDPITDQVVQVLPVYDEQFLDAEPV